MLHHAEAILKQDMPGAVKDLDAVLSKIDLPINELIKGGGGEGKLTQRMRNELSDLGWEKHTFNIRKMIDGQEKESISHEVDHVKSFSNGIIALEIEWNNKDPFYDRDLENFKRLHAEGAISVGVIVTRGASLQDSFRDRIESFALSNGLNSSTKLEEFYDPTKRQLANIEKAAESKGSFEKGWAHSFVSDKFGEATTHWRKLEDRVKRGVGNPCPLLLIGISDEVLKD